MNLTIGDKYKVDYPFKFVKDHTPEDEWFTPEDVWLAGCHLHVEDGPAVYQGYCVQENFYHCDAVGCVEFEILAIAELVGKFTDRVILRKTYHYPDGKVKKFAPEMMTVTLLESRLKNPFKVEYEVDPSKEAIESLSN